LTFWMYNHTAIFPEAMWPKAVRTNGHLQLNGAKMAKQTGNFLTLKESVLKFSADAMRLVLAEAGDSNEDANFNESDADKRILWLTTELNWVESIVSGAASAQTVNGPVDRLVDRIFENKIRKCVNAATAAYEGANYNKAVVAGFFEMQLARDEYRTLLSDRPYHKDLMMLFIRCQTLLLAPITPHLCEHLWQIMGNSGSVTSAPWPVLPAMDLNLDRMASYLETQMGAMRRKAAVCQKPKGKTPGFKPASCEIVIALSFKDWQITAIDVIREVKSSNGGVLPQDWKKRILQDERVKPRAKEMMPFIDMVIEDMLTIGDAALDTSSPFDEAAVLNEVMDMMTKELALVKLTTTPLDDAAVAKFGERAADAVPLRPLFMFSKD
jgi:leucyl-tRNA synthetase